MSTKQTFRQAKTYVASRTFMQTDPYYDDPFFKSIHAAQKGELPFPSASLGSDESPAADGTAEPESAPDGPNTSQPDGGAGAVVAEQAENLSVAEASVKPHRTTIRTPKRKRQAKAVVHARQDMEQRQTELDLSIQQRLDLPEPGTVAEGDIEALRVADAELAELETSFSVGQGGLTSTAAE